MASYKKGLSPALQSACALVSMVLLLGLLGYVISLGARTEARHDQRDEIVLRGKYR